MNQLKIAAAIALGLALACSLVSAANLSEQDKKFLSGYENAHLALTADNLDGAKAAVPKLGNDGAELSESASLKDARAAFEKLSAKAKQLTAGQSGYYVVNCPMLKKDWVQTSTTIANPYGGKDMATCGEVKK
ncbi:MAG: DUF3347 domain-containing protein [Chthoniobacterales bacterium]|nr:DUF3347 domain-containing protein [Chthoniobacterales bacterium]